MVNTEALEDAVDSAVPIHTKVIANQDLLYSLLSGQPLPPDDDKHHFFLKPKQLSPNSARYSQFSDLLSFCISGTTSSVFFLLYLGRFIADSGCLLRLIVMPTLKTLGSGLTGSIMLTQRL
jgi:hypothetical protein